MPGDKADKQVNILTVDLEDWPQSTLNHNLPVTSRVVINTKKLLDILGRRGVKATFFILGKVARAYPGLVLEAEHAGHEIAIHGFGHESVFNLTPSEFVTDVRQSIDIIEDIIGKKVIGYRAPNFSIIEKSLWALDILAEHGIRYDSSIFPIYGRRYGMGKSPRFPYRVNDRLYEIPLSTVRLGGINFPVCGGGYFRILPYWFTKQAVRRINSGGNPAVVYMHPYELDPGEFKDCDVEIPFPLRVSQGLGRKDVKEKLEKLLTDFEFKPIREAVPFDK